MFDAFFVDHLNGHELYDELEEDNDSNVYPAYGWCRNASRKSANMEFWSVHLYGELVRETDKGVLFRLFNKKDKKFLLGSEKWLPKSHISMYQESDLTDADEEKFEVNHTTNAWKISIPFWLYERDADLRDKKIVYSSKSYKR